MSLNIDNQTKIKVDLVRLESIYAKASEAGLLCQDYELEVCLCDAQFIRRHNKDFRGLDEKTDVLTFAMTPSSGSLLICLEYLLDRSGAEGLAKDLQTVFAHGVCHLAGSDHLTAEQTKKMQAQEKLLMSKDR